MCVLALLAVVVYREHSLSACCTPAMSGEGACVLLCPVFGDTPLTCLRLNVLIYRIGIAFIPWSQERAVNIGVPWWQGFGLIIVAFPVPTLEGLFSGLKEKCV